MTKKKAIEAAEGRFPRGHAFMHFRNKGYTIKVDYMEKHVPYLEDIVKDALKRMNDEDAAALAKKARAK